MEWAPTRPWLRVRTRNPALTEAARRSPLGERSLTVIAAPVNRSRGYFGTSGSVRAPLRISSGNSFRT
jgi:hypothetical protein